MSTNWNETYVTSGFKLVHFLFWPLNMRSNQINWTTASSVLQKWHLTLVFRLKRQWDVLLSWAISIVNIFNFIVILIYSSWLQIRLLSITRIFFSKVVRSNSLLGSIWLTHTRDELDNLFKFFFFFVSLTFEKLNNN